MADSVIVPKVGRSVFKGLSHAFNFDASAGQIIPVLFLDVVPNDTIKLGLDLVVRMNPTVSPFFSDVNAYLHYFFVPYRLLDKKFPDFITSIADSESDISIPHVHPSKIQPRNINNIDYTQADLMSHSFWDYLGMPLFQVPDSASPFCYPFLAYAMIFDHYYRDEKTQDGFADIFPDESDRFYCDLNSPGNLEIKPQYFSDFNLIDYFAYNPFLHSNNEFMPYSDLFFASWRNDYFTGALQSPQLGEGIKFPISGVVPLSPSFLLPSSIQYFRQDYTFPGVTFNSSNAELEDFVTPLTFTLSSFSIKKGSYNIYGSEAPNSFSCGVSVTHPDGLVETYTPDKVSIYFEKPNPYYNRIKLSLFLYIAGTSWRHVLKGDFVISPSQVPLVSMFYENAINFDRAVPWGNDNIDPDDPNSPTPAFVDLTHNIAPTLEDIRQFFAVSNLAERLNYIGNRYSEFLRMLGADPKDARLQRPEFLGSVKCPILVSDVLQTSETSGNSPQGNATGRGILANSSKISTYHVNEYGCIMAFLIFLPRASYSQGVERQFFKNTKFDFWMPDFNNLGPQEIYNCEIFAQPVSPSMEDTGVNKGIFGFRDHFDEMRFRTDRVAGNLRPDRSLGFWTLSRYFTQPPHLNKEFKNTFNHPQQGGIPLNRVMAVPSEPPFIVSLYHRILAVRPIPKHMNLSHNVRF